MNELKNSVSSLNKDVEEEVKFLEVFSKESEGDHRRLELQLLNYEVCQRRENLRFYKSARKARTRTLRKPCIISLKRKLESKMLAGSNSNKSTG